MPLPERALEPAHPSARTALAPAAAALARPAPGAAVSAARAGHHGDLPRRHAARVVRRLERYRAPAGGRLRGPAGRRDRLAARPGARAGAGAAATAVAAHR